MNKFYSAILICLLISKGANGQDVVGFGSSPSASGGGTAVQNNLFDGSANVSVPFYSSNIDGVPVNVGISYNTKGIKVDQLASCVGLGWSLNSGPTISRMVKDQPDEIYIPTYGLRTTYTMSHQAIEGYWYNSQNTGLSFIPTVDDEMDEFYMDLNGRGIRFAISKTGQVITFPKVELKIERIIDGNIAGNTALATNVQSTPHQLVLEFMVTDEQGTKYKFTRGDVHYNKLPGYENTSYGLGQINFGYNTNYYEVTDRWVIQKITTANGKVINYTYSFPTADFTLNSFESLVEPQSGQPSFTQKLNSFYGWMAYPTLIELPTSTYVEFNYNTSYSRYDLPNGKILDNIRVHRYYQPCINNPASVVWDNEMKFKFNQTYFRSNSSPYQIPLNYSGLSNSDQLHLRLKLNSIDQVIGANSKGYYSFEYDGRPLPDRLSLRQDFYGYYSGRTPYSYAPQGNLQCGIIAHQFPGNGLFIGIDRGADDINYSAGFCNLTAMKNGMGGETRFTYAAHTVTDLPTSQLNIIRNSTSNALGSFKDGLRLTSMLTKDGYNSSNDVLTVYSYVMPGSNEVGQIFMPGGAAYYTMDLNGNTAQIYFSSLLSSNAPINGANHGYPYVAVYQQKVSGYSGGYPIPGAFISKKEYYFTTATHNYNYITGTSDGMHWPSNVNSDPASEFNQQYDQPPFTFKQYFKELCIGLPVKIIDNDANGNPLSQVENFFTWAPDYKSSADVKSIKYLQKQVSSYGTITDYYKDIYYCLTGTMNLTQVVNKKFVSNGSALTSTISYQYDSHNNMYQSNTNNSEGDPITIKTYYNYNWAGSSNASAAINNLNGNNIQVPVLSETWRGTGSSSNLVSSTVNCMGLISGRIYPDYLYEYSSINGIPQSSYAGGPSQVNLNTMAAGGSTNNYTLMGRIVHYDLYGHPLEKEGSDNNPITNFYNGAHDQLLAVVNNSRFYDAAYTSFDGTYQPVGIFDQNKGNWNFNPLSVLTASSQGWLSLSGKFIYRLPANTTTSNISSTYTLTTGKKYIIEFWSRNGLPVVKESGISLGIAATSLSRGGWYKNRVEFVSSGGYVTIEPSSSSQIFIDELRLYPSGAALKSKSYDPMFGVISSCDENGIFEFYDLDMWGNVITSYDNLGRVVMKKKFVQQGLD